MGRAGWAVVLGALALATVAPAQVPTSHPICFRGGPASRCSNFLLTEFALRLAPPSSYRRPAFNTTWDVGLMHNTGERRALGASLAIVFDDEARTLVGVRPRARFWLSRAAALDIAPGILFAGEQTGASFPVSFPAFSGFVGVTFADLIALDVQVEALPLGGTQGTETKLYGGVRLGSYAGTIVGPAAAFLIALARSFSD